MWTPCVGFSFHSVAAELAIIKGGCELNILTSIGDNIGFEFFSTILLTRQLAIEFVLR